MFHLTTIAFLSGMSATALGIPTTPAADCARADLRDATAGLIAAQGTGVLSSFTALSDSVTYTENFQSMDISDGILSQPLEIDHNRSIYDTTACSTFTELIITDPSHPYVLGTQMQMTDGMITKIETLVTDDGDWLFNATGTLYWSSREDWTAIPEASRDSRETIKAAGDAYLDLFNNASVTVPWGTPCDRLEGGAYTGTGSPTDSCNVGVPSGVSLVNRRYVVDEMVGSVDIMLNFGGDTGAPDSHQFRVEGGKIRFVHTITVM